ncbi:MAG: hypothetical protein Q8S00_18645 [Deltaproteobacteria bacterium]|nr:hypothetical protein [Deltaproteobacteria bacterium]MDZ4346904.1 hypothetical protein [Candidatus Binatia bacterium]
MLKQLNPFEAASEVEIDRQIEIVRGDTELDGQARGEALNRLYQTKVRRFGFKVSKNTFQKRGGEQR